MFCNVSGKLAYADRKEAIAHLASVKTKGRRPQHGHMRVYVCKQCGNYHVGHESKEKKANKA